jgi:hypothetical protein
LFKSDEEKGDLKIVRYLPSGELTNVCPVLNVTFSQPMIKLSTVKLNKKKLKKLKKIKKII